MFTLPQGAEAPCLPLAQWRRLPFEAWPEWEPSPVRPSSAGEDVYSYLSLPPGRLPALQGVWKTLREAATLLSPVSYRAVAKASEMLSWSEGFLFCPRCGHPLSPQGDLMRKCPSCGMEHWPRVNVAAIVLIMRGDRALLVRAHNFVRPFFGLVAGFLEPGETLEECVRREVWEETQLRISQPRYITSQVWPYPANLMCAFSARWESGELSLQESELADGGWFTRHDLPVLPDGASIARRLIDAWKEGSLL